MLMVRVWVAGMVQVSQGIPDYECLSKINGVPSVRHGLDVRLWGSQTDDRNGAG